MNIKKHHKNIIILNKIINNLITEEEKEDLSGYSAQELMDKAYSGLKKSLGAQKSQLGQFKEIDVDIEQGSSRSITSQVWAKLGEGNIIKMEFTDTIDNLEIPDSMNNASQNTKIPLGVVKLKAKSFNDSNFIVFEKSSGTFDPGGIKDVLMSFKRTAEPGRMNHGSISVYDTGNGQFGAPQKWEGRITKYKS